jgi:multimeric flavodoxin WrbA
MKILALQGSPRPKKYTQMVLDKFLEGAASKGAECETVHLAGQKIHPCIGCYSCWYKTPGVCIHWRHAWPAGVAQTWRGGLKIP